MNEESEQQPAIPDWLLNMDLSTDSVRLIGDEAHCKAMVIFDVTPLTEEQREVFANRALVALTRMGQKVVGRRNQN